MAVLTRPRSHTLFVPLAGGHAPSGTAAPASPEVQRPQSPARSAGPRSPSSRASDHPLPALPASPPAPAPHHVGAQSTQLMSLTTRPDDPGDAAREAVVDAWTLTLVGDDGRKHAVRVRPLLVAWDEALRAQYHNAKDSALLGGSIVNFRLNPSWRAQRPADIDPLFIVPGRAQGCVQTLQMRALTALSAVFSEQGWPMPQVISHILDHERASALVLMTLQSEGTHIDVRLAFDDTLADAFDFRCNGLVCDLRDGRSWGVLPGLDMKTVVDENNQGIYTQTRALKRDSLKRGTKMRMRGFVPGNPVLDHALVATFVAFLNAHPQVENKGFGLLFAEWLHKLLADYDSDASRGPKASTTFLLNLIVQIGQAAPRPQSAQMLAQLRRALARYTQQACLGAQSRCVLEAVQTDISARALGACLDALATETEVKLDAAQVRSAFELRRVPAPGCDSIRVYLPELNGYLVWPLRRPWCIQDDAAWPQPHDAHSTPTVTDACAWLGDASLAALWQTEPARDRATAELHAQRLARLAAQKGRAPTEALRLLWAAHCLDGHVELDDAIAQVLASHDMAHVPSAVRQASEALSLVHKQRGWQRLEHLLHHPRAAAQHRHDALQLARRWLNDEGGSPAAICFLRALTTLPALSQDELRLVRDMLQDVQPAALDAQGLAALVALWATSMHQPHWAPLQHALTRFVAFLPTCASAMQKQVWHSCADHLPQRSLWHVAARLPHLFRTSSPPDVARGWLEALSPEVLAQEPIFMAQLLATLEPKVVIDVFVDRPELVAALLKTQTGYIAVGRLLAASETSAHRIHIEHMWLQTDADFVPSAALHVCGIMHAAHPLFLCTVTRALKQQRTLSAGAQIQLLNQLWGKLARTSPNHRIRMQRLVRAALMQVNLLTLDRLAEGAWPKVATLRQWAALFEGCDDSERMHIHLICAFVGYARRDVALTLDFMGRASARRSDNDLHLPALMALFYRAVALLEGRPPEDVARAGAMLSRMTRDPNPQGSVWDHCAIATWRETAHGLMRLGELKHSTEILESIASGPYAAYARETIFNSQLEIDDLLASETDRTLIYALKNHRGDLHLLDAWAGALCCELMLASMHRYAEHRIEEGNHALDRALLLAVHRKPEHSFWRADPVFATMTRAFAKAPNPHLVQCFFDMLHDVDARLNLEHIDVQMLVRNRAILELAWVESTTDPTTAKKRAIACLHAFGIDTNLERPLAETLLKNAEEVEPLSLVLAQLAGPLCFPSKASPAEAAARLTWIVEGLSHAPTCMRALSNVAQHTAAYDRMAATKIGLNLTVLLANAIENKEWMRATCLASLSIQFACSVVYEQHTKHAINLIRATATRLCQIPNARWQGWLRLLHAVHTMADLAIANEIQHESKAAQDALRGAVVLLHKATAVVQERAANAESDPIALIDPPDPEALFKHAQFTVIMSELTDGPVESSLKTLLVRLSTMQDGLAQTVELGLCASFMIKTAFQTESLQRAFFTNLPAIHDVDLRLLTRIIDGIRSWRPLCEEAYACILEKAVHQRLKGQNKGDWAAFSAHIFEAMRSDIREVEPTFIKLVLGHIERFDSTTRRRNPWLVPFKQEMRAFLEDMTVIRGHADRIMQEAKSLLP